MELLASTNLHLATFAGEYFFSCDVMMSDNNNNNKNNNNNDSNRFGSCDEKVRRIAWYLLSTEQTFTLSNWKHTLRRGAGGLGNIKNHGTHLNRNNEQYLILTRHENTLGKHIGSACTWVNVAGCGRRLSQYLTRCHCFVMSYVLPWRDTWEEYQCHTNCMGTAETLWLATASEDGRWTSIQPCRPGDHGLNFSSGLDFF